MSDLVNDVQVSQAGTIVSVCGEITLDDSPQFHARLVQIVEKSPPRLIIDLAKVTHIDSAGVGTLVEVFRRVKNAGGRMYLSGLTPRVRGVFEITKLDRFFPIVETPDEALSS